MKLTGVAVIISTIALFAVPGAHAQPGPSGPCAAASGASGPGMGMGCGAASGPHAHWGSSYTTGWSMMTPAERQAHRDALANFKSYDECKAYVDKHHQEMVSRAQAQSRPVPVRPRRDPCAPLKAAK